jgi:hypothetical protein
VRNSLGKGNFMQPMGRLSLHSKCIDFFSFKFLVGRRIFFQFSFVPNMFPSSSQWVPNFFVQSPPLLTYIYRWGKGGGTPLFHRIFYVGGASIVSIYLFFAMGQSNCEAATTN